MRTKPRARATGARAPGIERASAALAKRSPGPPSKTRAGACSPRASRSPASRSTCSCAKGAASCSSKSRRGAGPARRAPRRAFAPRSGRVCSAPCGHCATMELGLAKSFLPGRSPAASRASSSGSRPATWVRGPNPLTSCTSFVAPRRIRADRSARGEALAGRAGFRSSFFSELYVAPQLRPCAKAPRRRERFASIPLRILSRHRQFPVTAKRKFHCVRQGGGAPIR
jgi:hypothetical protein